MEEKLSKLSKEGRQEEHEATDDTAMDEAPKITPDNEITEEFFSFGYTADQNNFDEVVRRIGERGEVLAVDVLKENFGDEAEGILCNNATHKQQRAMILP